MRKVIEKVEDYWTRKAQLIRNVQQAVQYYSIRISDVSIKEFFLQQLRNFPEFFKNLAENGWYLSDELCNKMPWDFPDIVRNGDHEKIDGIMVELLQKRIDSIRDEIIDNYPKRSDVLSQGFHAHEQEMYCCSILVFYSQADGIFGDKFGGEFFVSNSRRKVARNEIKIFEDSISCVEFLISNPEFIQSKNLNDLSYDIRRGCLLANDSAPLWIPQSRRPKNFHGINRHQIMHGESVDYGNKLNSLKSISFLDWIHCLKRERRSRGE